MYSDIMEAAKEEGILNAHVVHTTSSYKHGERITHKTTEGDNRELRVCVELVDEREKLEYFFRKHTSLLTGKTVIYKEVEHWSTDL